MKKNITTVLLGFTALIVISLFFDFKEAWSLSN